MKFLEKFMKKNESMICLGLSFFLILFLLNNFFSLEGMDEAAMMNMEERFPEDKSGEVVVSNNDIEKVKLQEQINVNKNNTDKIAAKVRSLIDKYDDHTHSHANGLATSETDPTLKTEGETGIAATEMEEYME
tara:strand:- start:4629 stop:5027 length:399 start_codon:yes stop_codon:yes gene_type:complete